MPGASYGAEGVVVLPVFLPLGFDLRRYVFIPLGWMGWSTHVSASSSITKRCRHSPSWLPLFESRHSAPHIEEQHTVVAATNVDSAHGSDAPRWESVPEPLLDELATFLFRGGQW